MREVRTLLRVDGGDVALRIDRIDRDAREFEQLTENGTWRRVSLYVINPEDKFIIPGEVITRLAEELKGVPA